MKKLLLLGASFLWLSSSSLSAKLPGAPASSSYIGKRWMFFELNNGPSYKWKRLPDGGTLQYWRSDLAGCCTGGRNGSPEGTRCDLLIKLDKNKIIRQIRILESGIACGAALR